MADGITLAFADLSGVLAALNTWGANVATEAQGKLEQAGDMMLQEGDAHTPVDTGYMKSQNALDKAPGLVTYSNDTPYVLPVELGHHTRSGSWVDPQAFMVPAWDTARQWLEGELKNL